jgi:hypothetical protein
MFGYIAGTIGALAAATFALAPTASASTADSIVNGLRADGYLVQLSQTPTAPLTACSVNGVNKSGDGGALTAVVDVECPDGC